MLDFAIFAVTFLLTLVVAIIYLMPSSRKDTTIPGLDPATKDDGNLSDIGRAGSLHEFLLDLHGRFGEIASFWMGRQLVVSIASPGLFKQHQGVFDRPVDMFELFEPLIGTNSIQYANGAEGRKRRHTYDESLSHDSILGFYESIQKITDNLAKTLESKVTDEHVSLDQYMMAFALKSVLTCLMGSSADSDKDIMTFRTNYDNAWSELEKRLSESVTPEDDSPRGKVLLKAKTEMDSYVSKVIQYRKKHGSKAEDYLMIDRIMDYCSSEEATSSEVLTYIIGGFHTTGNLLTWAVYFISTHEDAEKKMLQEIKTVLGDDNINPSNFNDLIYTRQVVDETLRCSALAPWAARYQSIDSELGGHTIPKNTPVIHAIGVMLQDEKVWPLPTKFDPDRFNKENSKSRQSLAFSPFGFAGKRVCPGNRFAYLEATICLVTMIRKFKFSLVEGQVVRPVYGLVTHPEDGIWVTISKRK